MLHPGKNNVFKKQKLSCSLSLIESKAITSKSLTISHNSLKWGWDGLYSTLDELSPAEHLRWKSLWPTISAAFFPTGLSDATRKPSFFAARFAGKACMFSPHGILRHFQGTKHIPHGQPFRLGIPDCCVLDFEGKSFPKTCFKGNVTASSETTWSSETVTTRYLKKSFWSVLVVSTAASRSCPKYLPLSKLRLSGNTNKLTSSEQYWLWQVEIWTWMWCGHVMRFLLVFHLSQNLYVSLLVVLLLLYFVKYYNPHASLHSFTGGLFCQRSRLWQHWIWGTCCWDWCVLEDTTMF